MVLDNTQLAGSLAWGRSEKEKIEDAMIQIKIVKNTWLYLWVYATPSTGDTWVGFAKGHCDLHRVGP